MDLWKEMRRRNIRKVIELGNKDSRYIISYRKTDGVPSAITKFIYRDQVFFKNSFSVDIAMQAISNYLLTYDVSTEHFFSEAETIRELDRARQFASELVSGWFLGTKFRGDGRGTFGILSDEELCILSERNSKLAEIEDYIQDDHRFLMQSNTALRIRTEVGGKLYKVKLINHVTGWPLDLVRAKGKLEELIRCRTGIPEVDQLYPLGSSASNLLHGTFFYMDEELWRGSLKFRGFPDHDVSHVYGDRIFYEKPENVKDLFQYDDGRGNILWYSPADIKFAGLMGPSDVKRWIAPGSPVQDKHCCLSGIVVSNPEVNKQLDGILAIMPETAFSQLLKDSGQSPSLKAIQIASPRGKGVIRAVRNETFQNTFGLSPHPCEDRTKKPTSTFKLGDVVGKKTLDDLVDELYIKETPGSSVIRCVFFEKAIKQDYLIENRVKCNNPECSYFSIALNPKSKKCPKCKLPTAPIKYFQLRGNDFGIFKGDSLPWNESSAVTIQMVTRGNVDKDVLRQNMLLRMSDLRNLIVAIFTPSTLLEEWYPLEDKWYKKEITAKNKILKLLNLLELGWMNTSRGAIALIQYGIHPFYPVVDDRVAEVISRALIEAKRQYPLMPVTHKTDKGEKVRIRYGYFLVVPPLNEPAENTIRIPECLFPLVDKQRRVTIARNPIRVGDTDMATVFVDKEPSYGNVLEVPMSIWSHMQGDYDGDLGVVLPTWATGICNQNHLACLEDGKKEGKSKEKPWAVDQVVEQHLTAILAKVGIGIEDTLVTRIYTERVVLGVPFTDEEILYLQDRLQNSILAIKKDVNETLEIPTEAMKKDVKLNLSYVNPINVFLSFDPKNTRASMSQEDMDVEEDDSYRRIPSLIRTWAKEHRITLPNSPEKSYEWALVLQKFGKWVLEVAPYKFPKVAYRINNHPYKQLVEMFVDLPLYLLRRSPLSAGMYRRCFERVYQEAIADISTAQPSLMPQLEKLLSAVESAALEYTAKVNNYSKARSSEDASVNSAQDWKPVKDFCKLVNEKLRGRIQLILGDQVDEFKASWEQAVFGYAGSLGTVDGRTISPSFVFKISEGHVLRCAFSLYEDMFKDNEGGLDPEALGRVIGHLSQPKS